MTGVMNLKAITPLNSSSSN